MKEQALAKLAAEFGKGKYNSAANLMKKAVREALETFVRQDEEFAQAVVQGGTFEECMEAVSKNVGRGISDLDAYKRAVQFYFPGANVEFNMKIHVNPYESGANDKPNDNASDNSAITLNFDELFNG